MTSETAPDAGVNLSSELLELRTCSEVLPTSLASIQRDCSTPTVHAHSQTFQQDIKEFEKDCLLVLGETRNVIIRILKHILPIELHLLTDTRDFCPVCEILLQIATDPFDLFPIRSLSVITESS